MHPNIVFVDEHDQVIGAGTRKEAIEKGIRHRIARALLVNSKGEILMQKRPPHVKSQPNLWDQTATGHVDEGEEYGEAAVRELKEEVGVSGVSLTEFARWYAEEPFPPHVRKRFTVLYTGEYDGPVTPAPDEVAEVRWFSRAELKVWLDERPEDFTFGAREALKRYFN